MNIDSQKYFLSDDVHSFDAYYKNVIYYNNNLVIPYINLGISNHDLNPTENVQYIDFSYVVFEKVTYLTVYLNSIRMAVINKNKQQPTYYLGGTYLDFNIFVFNDMEICADTASLWTFTDSIISDSMWLPINTPMLAKNIEDIEVEEFFELQNIPSDIIRLIS